MKRYGRRAAAPVPSGEPSVAPERRLSQRRCLRRAPYASVALLASAVRGADCIPIPRRTLAMTYRVRNVFGQLLALSLAALPLAAQQTTGKVEGSVTVASGGALANAQVVIVGTSFGAVTDA